MPWIWPPTSQVQSTAAAPTQRKRIALPVHGRGQLEVRVHPLAAAMEGVAHADDRLVERVDVGHRAASPPATPRNGRSITPSTGTPSSSRPSITPHSGEPVA